MTALERLKQLSGLSGVSAGEALRKIAGASGLAGALMVGFSGLPTGTAAEHLLADGHQVVQIVGGGGTYQEAAPDALLQQIKDEDEILIMAVAQMVVSGVFTQG